MTMTKIPSKKPSGTYGHGPLKICFWKGQDDDHDQDFLKKDLLHIWSWSSDISFSNYLKRFAALNSRQIIQRKTKGGGKLGGGETYHKTPSQKRFWTPPPPPMTRFPAPVCFHPVVVLRGNRHRPGKSHFLRPRKLVLEAALYATFSPPKIARHVLPRPNNSTQNWG